MTDNEMRLMREMMREELAPLRQDLAEHTDRLGKLEATDRKHSGTHRDLSNGLRQSKTEINEKVDDTTHALAQRDHQIVEALQEVRGELAAVREQGTKSIVPAAQGAEAAAKTSLGTSRAIQVAADRADSSAKTASKRSKMSAISSTVTAVVVGIWTAYQIIAPHVGK